MTESKPAPIDEGTAHRLLTASTGAQLSPVELLLERLSMGDRDQWLDALNHAELIEETGITQRALLDGRLDQKKLQAVRADARAALDGAITSEDARAAAWAFMLSSAALAADHDVMPGRSDESIRRQRETFMELAGLLPSPFARLFEAAASRMEKTS